MCSLFIRKCADCEGYYLKTIDLLWIPDSRLCAMLEPELLGHSSSCPHRLKYPPRDARALRQVLSGLVAITGETSFGLDQDECAPGLQIFSLS